MGENFWMVVFAVGAAQGLFLCGALALRRTTNGTATRLLAAIVGIATLMIVAGALISTLPATPGQLLVFININIELAFGPLLLLFARSLVDPERRLNRGDALHFLPLAIGVLVWGGAWVVLGDVSRRDALLDHSLIVPTYVLLKAGWLFAYVAATHRMLRCDSRVSRLHAAGRRPIQLTWLRRGLLLVAAMAGTIYLTDLAGRFGIDLPFEADPYGSLVLAVVIYLASLMVLQRPWVLSLRVRPAAVGRHEGDVARLGAYMEREQPWRRPDLSLGDLARAMNATDNRLSAVIHDGLGTSFYALINRYRLDEFERLARDSAQRGRSVLELAYEAGFNSKASFYRVFRDSHGTTPTAFRRAG